MIKLNKDVVSERLSFRNISIIGEYNGAAKKSEFTCGNGHSWTGRLNNVLNRGCPTCNSRVNGGHHLYSKLTKEIVNERIQHRGITMHGSYHTQSSKTEFICKLEHKWLATPDSVMRLSGCPACANSGYKKNLPAYVYVLQFESFIKYGITNNITSRMARHKKNGKYDIVCLRHFASGTDARILEKKIKDTYGGHYVGRDQCPDGFTETLCKSLMTEVVNFINKDSL